MSQSNTAAGNIDLDRNSNGLIKAGGIAALIAGVLFRRNIAAEIAIFSRGSSPVTVNDWFELLQKNRLMGLVSLNILDLVNYALIGLMFLALYTVLKKAGRTCMTIAAVSGLTGIAVYFASNTALSMLSLSNQYVSAVSEAERNLLLSAGQSMLAFMRFGTGGFVSLFLIAAAGMLISIVMLKSKIFGKAAAYAGILAAGLDLAYCAAYVFVPVNAEVLSVCFIPAAGLFLMIWHILTGLRLFKLACAKKTAQDRDENNRALDGFERL